MVKTILETEKMIVLQAQLGDWDNLNHLLVCKKSETAVIVDPFSSVYWLEVCQKNNWELSQVWLTHSHWDHAKGVDGLSDKQVWVHSLEAKRGWDGPSNNEWNHDANSHVLHTIGELKFEVHCTPGHTPGHVTFIGEGVVISGDCMFLGSCGRTDLFGGDVDAQKKSLFHLRNRLQQIPSEWYVLPGHQYPLSDGNNPTYITVEKLLAQNEALLALDNDDDWDGLDFLAFDDNMAEKARRERARNS